MNQGLVDHTHHELDQQVTSIGGHYVLTKEVRLPFQGRELLYLTGYALFDTTCCGEGGCGYALVPGFIHDWKYKITEGGRPVSRAEPIRDKTVQQEVRRLIEKHEMVSQVSFS